MSMPSHVVKQSSQQNAGGLNEERRLPADAGIKPHLIADLLTKPPAPQAGNLPGNRSGRQPPRL
jgi:hypothetical protein